MGLATFNRNRALQAEEDRRRAESAQQRLRERAEQQAALVRADGETGEAPPAPKPKRAPVRRRKAKKAAAKTRGRR